MKFRSQRLPRQLIASVHDVTMAALSFFIALELRLGGILSGEMPRELWLALILFSAVCAGVFWFNGLYRGIWRYASLNDLEAIVRGVTIAVLAFLLVTFLVTRLEGVPRSSLIITWFVLIVMLGAPRMAYRVFKDRGLDHLLERDTHRRTPVLLVGAGDAADVFIREMARDRNAPYEVLGIVDEKGTRVGRRIRGVPVLGHLGDLERLLEALERERRMPQRVILTKRQSRENAERILDLADANGMTIARLPRLTEFRSGEDQSIELKPAAIEDLLGRARAKLDRAAMRRLVEGRRVLVTGAGGSIGAELARQVAALNPTRLVLLDNSEYQLYQIGLDLSESHAGLSRDTVLADVRDRARLEEVFATESPDLVFHAAALKHVPLVEANSIEGVLTNVIGTRYTAEACHRAGVAAMVLVSTDKAVNPSSVMGATKRLAEAYCQALDLAELRADGPKTRFVTVRFGNVLGSTGSVVPLFHRQLATGGPLTVTHPEMSRYFMTVQEAVELVLQASALGIESSAEKAGKIYVLDMGEPVKIMDLARQMIRLAGLRPDKDVAIEIVGVRPGEKLEEELFHEGEPLVPTRHEAIRIASPRTTNLELLARGLDELAENCSQRDSLEVFRLLTHLVPEYQIRTKERAAVLDKT